ncbi:MAG: beta-hydroxyacyl-ACP dehydratase [Bacteroidales bacterium]|nr:beta-hydroxyacyl-ACP dehydratase [Bacteroidales bacterium]
MDIQKIYKDEDIKKLLNQRNPILMVDSLSAVDDLNGLAGLTIHADNMFCYNGKFTEPGLIEHIAQSASAFVSYRAIAEGTADNALLGFIGEVKKFKLCGELPSVNDILSTTVSIQSSVMNITMFSAETKVNDRVVATCQMKLSV